MFVDTSAIVAILSRETDADDLSAKLEAAQTRLTSPLVRLEACMVLATKLRMDPADVEPELDEFFLETGISVVPIDDETGRLAVAAFRRYGKGRGSPARLNLADCLSYACARQHNVPILFKGRDVSHTDIPAAS
ncbi:type II toxin-antitoxin system VapC family toxin [Enterovirga rhinocerotis]|uniref:Ribonuclease VapC n=1 Tax=Enterovirga rhinocerotis TaxID=1339210 RepID=A0A4R7CA36_9HYPH|nr:type II toxin-antitoxin system VapC family toxin [Enterovirga rhinocerotis]TDR93647.1 ribonuclease VapC [Enterovirga rhinocerotis]